MAGVSPELQGQLLAMLGAAGEGGQQVLQQQASMVGEGGRVGAAGEGN